MTDLPVPFLDADALRHLPLSNAGAGAVVDHQRPPVVIDHLAVGEPALKRLAVLGAALRPSGAVEPQVRGRRVDHAAVAHSPQRSLGSRARGCRTLAERVEVGPAAARRPSAPILLPRAAKDKAGRRAPRSRAPCRRRRLPRPRRWNTRRQRQRTRKRAGQGQTCSAAASAMTRSSAGAAPTRPHLPTMQRTQHQTARLRALPGAFARAGARTCCGMAIRPGASPVRYGVATDRASGWPHAVYWQRAMHRS